MISTVYGTNHLYQESIKFDQQILRYGSKQTDRRNGWKEWTEDAKTISLRLCRWIISVDPDQTAPYGAI